MSNIKDIGRDYFMAYLEGEDRYQSTFIQRSLDNLMI